MNWKVVIASLRQQALEYIEQREHGWPREMSGRVWVAQALAAALEDGLAQNGGSDA